MLNKIFIVVYTIQQNEYTMKANTLYLNFSFIIFGFKVNNKNTSLKSSIDKLVFFNPTVASEEIS
jgi:hypothetical protein